jgi:hypothetical protein
MPRGTSRRIWMAQPQVLNLLEERKEKKKREKE